MSRERWGTRIGVILAVSGSAVGIGNFLRFPGKVAENGGGAFMIPYFCALFLLGIPICWAEWAMGKYGGQYGFSSYPAVFGLIGRRAVWRYLGVFALVVPILVYMYYILLEAWCLGYAWRYLSGTFDLGADPTKFAQASKGIFAGFIGESHDGAVFDGGVQESVIFWILVFALNFYVIYRGISKGIENFCNVAMPLMTICGIIVLVRVLTLGTPNPDKPELNVLNGLGFMWNPKPQTAGGASLGALLDPKVWLEAAGQIFFTLSVGFGVIVNYASYLRKKDDVVLSGLTASATNEISEVCLGGLITIPAAFIFLGGMGIQQSLGSSFALGFHTLPVVFMHMPGGRFFGFLWFFMLFLAAICSSLSMLQPVIAFLEEGLGLRRRASCTMLGLLTVLGSLFVVYFSKDQAALATIDFWVGSVMVFILATIEVILFAWVFGAERGAAYANEGAAVRLPKGFRFVIKYVSPLYLLGVFVLWTIYNLPDEVERLAQGGVPLFTIFVIAGTAVFLLLLINIAGKRWKAETLDVGSATGPAGDSVQRPNTEVRP